MKPEEAEINKKIANTADKCDFCGKLVYWGEGKESELNSNIYICYNCLLNNCPGGHW